MKKITLSALALLASSAYALPTFSLNPTDLKSDATNTVEIIINQDASDQGLGYQLDFELALPAGVTLSNIAADRAASCAAIPGNPNGVTVADAKTTPQRDGWVTCTFDVVVPSNVTTGTVSINKLKEIQTTASGDNPGTTTLPSLTIGGGGTTDFNVTVDPSTNGSVSCTPLTGPANTSVTCTATPDANFAVDAWTGACQSTTAGAKTCNFSLTADTNVGATFKAATTGNYTVSVTQTAGGNVACNPTSGATGDTITCTATANSGFTVGGWNNAECSGQGATCTFTLGSANVSGVSATFRQNGGGGVSTSKPVPVLGMFGLLGLLASVFGAAAMVLRRK